MSHLPVSFGESTVNFGTYCRLVFAVSVSLHTQPHTITYAATVLVVAYHNNCNGNANGGGGFVVPTGKPEDTLTD